MKKSGSGAKEISPLPKQLTKILTEAPEYCRKYIEQFVNRVADGNFKELSVYINSEGIKYLRGKNPIYGDIWDRSEKLQHLRWFLNCMDNCHLWGDLFKSNVEWVATDFPDLADHAYDVKRFGEKIKAIEEEAQKELKLISEAGRVQASEEIEKYKQKLSAQLDIIAKEKPSYNKSYTVLREGFNTAYTEFHTICKLAEEQGLIPRLREEKWDKSALGSAKETEEQMRKRLELLNEKENLLSKLSEVEKDLKSGVWSV